jgi:translation elongation factor EF-Tu-like GTPase
MSDGDLVGLTMTIGDRFTIEGRGTVVVGTLIGEDVLYQGDVAFWAGGHFEVRQIEMFRKVATEARGGQNVGLLFGTEADALEFPRGLVLQFQRGFRFADQPASKPHRFRRRRGT